MVFIHESRDIMYYMTNYQSPVGLLTIAGNENNELIGLWMAGQKYFGGTISSELIVKDDLNIFIKTKEWLDRYFADRKPNLNELNLAPIGSEFRQDVWEVLCQIPYGEVTTYGAIAKTIAQKRNKSSISAQAVGGAVGHNPISIIIPCHRVIGTNKSLTGFAAGLDKKSALLKHEGYDISQLIIPTKGTAL